MEIGLYKISSMYLKIKIKIGDCVHKNFVLIYGDVCCSMYLILLTSSMVAMCAIIFSLFYSSILTFFFFFVCEGIH